MPVMKIVSILLQSLLIIKIHSKVILKFSGCLTTECQISTKKLLHNSTVKNVWWKKHCKKHQLEKTTNINEKVHRYDRKYVFLQF